MKYRIKQYEDLVTRYKGGKIVTEGVEKIYQIEYKIAGFWGYLFSVWSEIGSQFFTEEEARDKVEYYKKLDKGPRFKKQITYINLD
jgi:hypothetical protein